MREKDMWDWNINKKNEKVTEKNSKKEGKYFQLVKVGIFLIVMQNRKWILQANHTNHNPKNYKGKTHRLQPLSRVGVFWPSNKVNLAHPPKGTRTICKDQYVRPRSWLLDDEVYGYIWRQEFQVI